METKEVIELYGDLPLKFSSYYKYSFTYEANAPDGTTVWASYGGCADDIYRHEVKAGDTITLRAGDQWNCAGVYRDGKSIWSTYKD